MISTAMGNLLDRAERAGAALIICDAQDRIIRVNDKHVKIYNFIDYSIMPTFEQFLWTSINNRKMANGEVYRDPHSWISATAQSRKSCKYLQFTTKHNDERMFLVSYEKILDSSHWWYQTRIDITEDIKKHFKDGNYLLGPSLWDGTFAPMARNTTVPIANVLGAMPAAAGLIMAKGKLIDANQSLSNLLREGDGLRLIGGRVVIRNNQEQVEFLKKIDHFFAPAGSRLSVNMRISREDSEDVYFLNVSSLLDQNRETWDSGHIGVITVANPSITPTIDPNMLVTFFGITLAEAEVAAALGAGQSVSTIAQKRMVQINTIHAQIKKIVEKTGYKGQADIARRVSDVARIFGSR